jgi:hypothetical protein
MLAFRAEAQQARTGVHRGLVRCRADLPRLAGPPLCLAGVHNLVGEALIKRIVRAHEAAQPFRVVVCMPLFPGGQPPAVPFSVNTAGCIGSLGSKRALAAATC